MSASYTDIFTVKIKPYTYDVCTFVYVYVSKGLTAGLCSFSPRPRPSWEDFRSVFSQHQYPRYVPKLRQICNVGYQGQTCILRTVKSLICETAHGLGDPSTVGLRDG